MATWTSRTSPTTSWTARTPPTTNWTSRTPIKTDYLLDIGNGTYLMINDTDFLFIKDSLYGTEWTGRVIPT